MVKKQNVKQFLWHIVKSKKQYIFLLFFFQGFLGISGMLVALMLRKVIDTAAAENAKDFWWAVEVFGVLIAAQLLARVLLRYLEEATKADLEIYLKERLLKSLLNCQYAAGASVHSGEWLTRLTSDTVIVADGVVTIVPGAVGMLLKLLSAFAALILLLPWMGGWLILLGVVVLLLTAFLRKPLKELHKLQQEADAAVRICLQEQMESRMLLKVFGTEAYSQEVAKCRMKKHQKQRIQRMKWSIFCSGGFSAILRVVYLAGAISCGYGMLQGSISYGTLTAVLQLVGQLQTPLTGLTGYVPKYFALLASAERILEPEEFPRDKEIGDRTEFTKLILSQVSFKYPGEKEYILKDISAEIKSGEMIAFIGYSGCGKSTLMKLILGLYDITEGELYFLPKEGTGNLKGFCSYVPQGKYLMNGTIRDIITLGKTNAPDSEKKLLWAIQTACAEFVRELEKGIDTELGEQGAGLSEGQLQRLSIARALYADKPIIILDEATSALDEETEWNVLNNLKNIKNKTFLVVTHRPAALNLCDRILDLNFENQR